MRVNLCYFVAIELLLMLVMSSCGGKPESYENFPVVQITPTLTEAVKNYYEVGEFHNGLAMVKDSNGYGFIDSIGNEVIPCIYKGLSYHNPGYYTTYDRNSSKRGLVDIDGNRITDDIYEKVEYSELFDRIVCSGDYKLKYYNLQGEESYPDIMNKKAIEKASSYGEMTSSFAIFYDGLALVGYYDRPKQTHYKKFINEDGDIVMSVTEKNGKFGVTDSNGKEIVPHQFTSINKYDSGYLIVSDGVNREGLWDLKNGQQVLEPIYDIVSILNDRYLVLCHSGGVKSLLDITSGKVIIDSENGATGFDILSNGFIEAWYDHFEEDLTFFHAIFNSEGKEVIGKSDYITECREGYVVRRDGKMGVLDINGKEIVGIDNYHCEIPSEGLIAVQHEKSGKFGFVNMKGKYVIEPKYDKAGFFNEGLAPVEIDGRCGYVNREGVDTF